MENAASLLAAQRWEAGCVLDRCRNEFVVPAITNVLAERRPSRILDLGAGTGFVARVVDQALCYSPSWTLLDCDQARLSIAADNAPSSMKYHLVHQDSLEYLRLASLIKYDAIIICFTILEFSAYDELLYSCAQALNFEGELIIVLPDPWEELISSAKPVSQLLTGRVSINKIDKFTGKLYPYYISRIEQVISNVLAFGLAVTKLTRSDGSSPVYVMAFRKQPSIPS
jgi:ubiquinone/menaquinone biosynthesis C-methylase UbiE